MASTTLEIDGKDLALTNLDKVMYPETGFTKGQVIEYYKNISRYILPHIEDRPITMKRFPNGIAGQHFYEKEAPSHTPSWAKTFQVPSNSKNSVINYILLNDIADAGLVGEFGKLGNPSLPRKSAVHRPADDGYF